MKSQKLKVGFTLIELLITVAVLGLILTAMVGIFLTTIKAGKKADAIAEVKENGDYALGVMERLLRNVEEVNCAGSTVNFRLPEDEVAVGTTRSFTLGGVDNEQILYDEDTSDGNPGGSLTNRNLEVSGLSFSCSGDPIKTVAINFTISKGERTDVREFASVSFTGKVKVRKY